MRILVVDDEPQVGEIIAYVLEEAGYAVEQADCLSQARQIFASIHTDLVILDVMLPDGSGMELCHQIRSVSRCPIILLSALAEEEHRVAGLEAGADDYLVKPFSPRELVLRAGAVLRRQNAQSDRLSIGNVVLNAITGEFICGEKSIQLPIMETRVLALLMCNLNKTVSFERLLHEVWNTDETVGGREMVRITIHRLRKHLRSCGLLEGVIETLRGRGYRIQATVLVGENA